MFKIAKQIRIGVKLDKSGFQKELNQLLKKGYDLNLNGGNFKNVINDISKELNKLKSTLNNVNGSTFDNAASGVNKTKDAVKDLNSELTRMSSKNLSSTSIIADKNGLSEINKYKDGIAQTTSEVIKNGQVTKQVITENISQFNNLKNQLQNKLLTAKSNNLIDSTVIDKLQAKLNSLDTNSSVIKVKELQTAINNLGSNDSGIVRLQNSITKLQERIANIKKNKIDVIDTSEINELKMAESEVTNLKNMLSQLKAGDVIDGKKITSSINQATNSVRTLESEFRNVNTTASGLATTMKSIFSYAIGGSVIYAAMNSIREAVNITIELNSAMTNLKKVTDETSETYTSFLNNMHNVALELGTQSNAMVDATTNWAKTGKNLQEAAELAENTVLLTKVGDVDNVDTAQTYMLPALQAFNIEAEKSITLIDKYNNISNNMATTVNDVGDAMSKSASSMSVAGNSLEQTIALIATAESQTKLGGAEVGTALKTLSMRLATFKDTETGEVIPQMTEKIKELTNVDITDLNGQLKNTYDIYTEIGKVYKDLDQNTQMQLNEILGGKLRGNIVSAILSHVSELQRAYDLANDSAGSAMNEFEKYQDSIQYSVDRLKEQINGLYTSFIGSDFLKSLTEGTASTIGAIQNIINTFGTMPTTITAVVGAMTIFNKSFRENAQILTSSIPLTNSWQSNLLKTETSLKSQITSIKANITQLKSYSLQYSEAGLSTKGFGKNLLSLNGQLALTTTGMIATKVAIIALNAAMSMALTMGISAIISGLGSLIDKITLTRSELNELNQEFVTTNSDSEMSNVIDLVNTYEELQNTLSTLKKGTSEYKEVEDKLASTQESIISIYPSASKVIENNTEAKRLNLEATKKLIDKDLELAKSDALNILEKNDTKTDTGLDKAIEQYQEYYKVLEKVNDLAEKEETKSVNIKSDLSDSGELLVNAKDVDTYKKRVESLNDTLEASYEAYKILGVSNDKYAEKAKKVGEALGYSASQTEELINKLKETDESADETADALEDINGDGIIDAADQMLKLAETTDEAKTAVQNLGDAFSQLESPIKMLETAIEEFKEYGMVSDDTWSDIITSGNSELIALLGDNENFLKNAEQLYGNLKTQQEELAKQTIRRAQEEVNASGQVVDGLNEESQALSDLENTKANISTAGANERSNIEAQVVSNNSRHYALDEANHNNKEDYKIKGSFGSANSRMSAEKDVVDNNSKNYSTDSSNHASVENSKIKNADAFANASIQGVASMVTNNNSNYKTDASNFASATNSKLANIRALNDAVGASAGLLNEYKQLTAEAKETSKIEQSILYGNNGANLKKPSIGSVGSSYVGSGGLGNSVSHGSLGTGSSGNKSSSGSSSSTKKEVEDMKSLVDRYVDLDNTINKVENSLASLNTEKENANDENKIKLLQKEISLLGDKRVALENLRKEQQKELSELKSQLSNKGFNFNSDGDITNINSQLEALRNNANSLSGDAKENAQESVKAIAEIVERYNELLLDVIPETADEINDMKNQIIDAQKDIASILEEQRDDYIDNLKKETEALKKELQKRKDLMSQQWDEEDYDDNLVEYQGKINELESQLSDALRTGDQELIKSVREQIADAQKELNDFIRDHERDVATDRIDSEMDALDEDLDAKIEEINNKLSDEQILQLVQSGVTDLNSTLDNISNATKSITSTFAAVGTIINDCWISNLDSFINKLQSLNTITPNVSFNTSGEISARGLSGITVTGGDVIIQGDITEDVLPKVESMIEESNRKLVQELNNVIGRN